MSILTLDHIHTAYGPTRVLHGLSLTLAPGEALAVLGRNGAGKTTLLKSIIGLVPVQSGSISLEGVGDIAGADHRRARLGIGYVPQGRRLFPRLTVAENIRMGTTVRPDSGDADVLDAIYQAFPKLAQRRNQKAGTLSRRRAADGRVRPRDRHVSAGPAVGRAERRAAPPSSSTR